MAHSSLTCEPQSIVKLRTIKKILNKKSKSYSDLSVFILKILMRL
jgi:hypothetical protein